MLIYRVKQLTIRTSRYQREINQSQFREINQSQFSVKFTSFCQHNIKSSVCPSGIDKTSRTTCVHTKILGQNSVNS